MLFRESRARIISDPIHDQKAIYLITDPDTGPDKIITFSLLIGNVRLEPNELPGRL